MGRHQIWWVMLCHLRLDTDQVSSNFDEQIWKRHFYKDQTKAQSLHKSGLLSIDS